MSNVTSVDQVGDLTQTVPAKPKGQRKVRKYVIRISVVLLAAIGLAQLMYTLSGSEKWEVVKEDKGVTIYSMKTPGQNVKKFMAVFKLHASLSQTLAFAMDMDSDTGDGGFSNARVLERESPQVWWSYWRMRLPKPMQTRDYAVKFVATQDPKTKEVLYTLAAKPYMVPEEPCCIRVLKIDNSWRFTPLNSDETEVHWILDMDIGGYAPYFMLNKWFAWEMVNFAPGLQEIVQRPKYKNAKVEWLQEL